MNLFNVELENAEPKNYFLGLPSQESKLKFISQDTTNLQYPITLQNNRYITDLYFNDRINREIILRPNEQFTFQNLLFYHPSHAQFNATLLIKNSYSQFEAVPIRAKPIKLKVAPKYIAYFRCNFKQDNITIEIPICKIVQKKYGKSYIDFSIQKDDLIRLERQKSQTQQAMLSPMNRQRQMLVEWLKIQPIIGWVKWIKYDKFLPKKISNQKFIVPRIARKIIFQNQSGIYLSIKSISFAHLKCQDEFFVLLNCQRQQELEVAPQGQFQIIMYTKMDSVYIHGISWLYIQTDKLEFEIQALYSTDYQLLKLKNQLTSPPVTAYYVIVLSFSIFACSYITICCVKMLIDQYKVKKEAESSFWNLVRVNEAANNDMIFWIQYKPFNCRYPFEISQSERKALKGQNAQSKRKKKKKNIGAREDATNFSMDQTVVSGRDEAAIIKCSQNTKKINEIIRVQSQPENQILKIQNKKSQLKKGQSFEQTESNESSDTLQSFKIQKRSFQKIIKGKKSRQSSFESNQSQEFSKDLVKAGRKMKKDQFRRKDSTQSDQTSTIQYRKMKQDGKKSDKNLEKKEQTRHEKKEETRKEQQKQNKPQTLTKKEALKQKAPQYIKSQQVRHHKQLITPANLIQTTPRQQYPSKIKPKIQKYTKQNSRITNQADLQWVYDPQYPNELLEIPKQPDKSQIYIPRYHHQFYSPTVSYHNSNQQPIIYQKKIQPSIQKNPIISPSKYMSTRDNISLGKNFQSQEDFPELGGSSMLQQKKKSTKQQQKQYKGRWLQMIDTISTLNIKNDFQQKVINKNQREQTFDQKKNFLQDKLDQSPQNIPGGNYQRNYYYQSQTQRKKEEDTHKIGREGEQKQNIDKDEEEDDDEQEHKEYDSNINDEQPYYSNIWAQMVPVNNKSRDTKYHSLFGSDSDDSSEQDALSELRKASFKVQNQGSRFNK